MVRNWEGGTTRAGMASLPLSCIIMNFFVSEMDALGAKVWNGEGNEERYAACSVLGGEAIVQVIFIW